MERELTIDYTIRTTWLGIQRKYNEVASKYGSTMVTGFTLLSIDPKEGTPSTTLGPKMGIEPTSLSRTLKKLEEKKLVYRKPNPEDGRSVLICLTPEGIEMRDISKNVVLDFNKSVLNKIDQQELKTFYRVANQIKNIVLK